MRWGRMGKWRKDGGRMGSVRKRSADVMPLEETKMMKKVQMGRNKSLKK
jgi:hypothetical protein